MSRDGQPVDLISMAACEYILWMDGYRVGYMHGLDRGREHERQEAVDLWREAVRVVHNAASISPRDRSEDERQARRRAHWWSVRRGEVA